MAGDASNVHPTGAIVVDGKNKTVSTKKVETVTNVYPGRLLMRGTNDDDVVVSDGSTAAPCGWAGYLDTTKKYRPATIATIYVQNDLIAQINGPGMRLMAKLDLGSTVTVGMLLTAGQNGCLTPGTAGTHDIVAQALEAVTTTTAAANILVESRI